MGRPETAQDTASRRAKQASVDDLGGAAGEIPGPRHLPRRAPGCLRRGANYARCPPGIAVLPVQEPRAFWPCSRNWPCGTSAAKMPNTSRPAAVVVSICAPRAPAGPTLRVASSWHGVDEMGRARLRPGRSSFQTTSTSQSAQADWRVPAGRRVRRKRSRGRR